MQLRPPAGDDSNLDLAEIVAGEINERGPITFARFMEIVIQHPEHGYYAASVDRVGRTGDFLTAPETHPLFGWLVARQVHDCWESLGRIPKLTIREYGAGRGTLAIQILDWFSRHAPEGLESIAYQVEDLNPSHQARIEWAIEQAGPESALSVSGVDTIAVNGVVLANELLDALPFHRLVVLDEGIRELRVGLEDGWFVDLPGDISEAARSVLPDSLPITEGQIFEVSPSIRDWVHDLASALDRGFAIIIDYGDIRERLLDENRFPNGTLKTYRQHQVGDDPYRHLGYQDITAHVDFSLLARAAGESGLRVEGITTQAEFVAGLGLDEILLEIQGSPDSATQYPPARAAAMELLNPGGLGRFRVAILSRNVAVDRELKGLSFRLPGLSRS